jgi:hypothetical protein
LLLVTCYLLLVLVFVFCFCFKDRLKQQRNIASFVRY